jgi:hypothetical protein
VLEKVSVNKQTLKSIIIFPSEKKIYINKNKSAKERCTENWREREKA